MKKEFITMDDIILKSDIQFEIDELEDCIFNSVAGNVSKFENVNVYSERKIGFKSVKFNKLENKTIAYSTIIEESNFGSSFKLYGILFLTTENEVFLIIENPNRLHDFYDENLNEICYINSINSRSLAIALSKNLKYDTIESAKIVVEDDSYKYRIKFKHYGEHDFAIGLSKDSVVIRKYKVGNRKIYINKQN